MDDRSVVVDDDPCVLAKKKVGASSSKSGVTQIHYTITCGRKNAVGKKMILL